jgi:heme-degrading monooxygenase HmoA
MFARLVIFRVGSGKRSAIEKLVNKFDALYRVQKGFKHVFIVGDEASGEYGSFSVWESKEDADAANAVIASRLQQALAEVLQGPPDRWFFEVLESKSDDT